MARSMDFLASKCLSVIVAVLLLGPSAGCEFSCSTGGGGLVKGIEKSLAKQVGKNYDRKVKKVECHGDIEGKEDEVARCTVTFADGEEQAVEVLFTDDVGGYLVTFDPGNAAFMKKEVSEVISERLATKYGVEFGATICPEKVEFKQGESVECLATLADGSKLPVTVTWTSARGRYRYDEKGVISLAKIESGFAEQLAHEKTPGTVDCHGKLRVSEPESVFWCDIAYADGKRGKLKNTVLGWNSRVKWEVGPWVDDAAPKP